LEIYIRVKKSCAGIQKTVSPNMLLWTSNWEPPGRSKVREGLSLKFPYLPKDWICQRETLLPSNLLTEISLSKED
jgi:hypothetical protein